MSRPMKFDRDEAIAVAMNQFWHKGYEKNSVNALSAYLGITRSSFYNSFSSREQLFREAIDYYIADPKNSGLYLIPKNKPFKLGVERFFKELCKSRSLDPQHRGCLLVNSLAELSASKDNSDIVSYLNTIIKESKALLADRVIVAQDAGEISSELDSSSLALSLQNLSYGTNIMSKAVHDEKELWKSCAQILKGLGF